MHFIVASDGPGYSEVVNKAVTNNVNELSFWDIGKNQTCWSLYYLYYYRSGHTERLSLTGVPTFREPLI